MIIGVGIDIIEIPRIAAALQRHGFAEKVFTPAERRYCDSRGMQRAASYAARFAGKEAVLKALGTGMTAGSWQEIEILPNEAGGPTAVLSGVYAQTANALGVERVLVSLTHARKYAAAQAVLEGESPV